MSSFRVPSVLVFASMALALRLPARAAVPIEFEFGGVFTQSINSVHQVGEPFTSTVVFDRNAADTRPDPLWGEYAYIRWTAPSAGSTPIVFENVPATVGSIQVFLTTGSHTWKVDYQGATQFLWELAIDFPNGSFSTDALPQTLDLSEATGTRFRADDGALGLTLRGTITSLTVRGVPEPTLMGVVCYGFLAARRCRARVATK